MLATLYLLIVCTLAIVWIVEAVFRRRAQPYPWIYGWAASGLLLSGSIAFFCLRGGWGLAWSLGLALLLGLAAYPALRNLLEAIRTAPPRRVYYIDEGYEDPPIGAPVYQATDFGGRSAPIRAEPEPASPPAKPAPRSLRWQDANIPEFRRAAAVTCVSMAMLLVVVCITTPRPWLTREGHVAAMLVDAGYQAVRVHPAPTGDHCPAGRATPYRWTAPGVEGEACRSNSGRVSYWVVRRWRRAAID